MTRRRCGLRRLAQKKLPSIYHGNTLSPPHVRKSTHCSPVTDYALLVPTLELPGKWEQSRPPIIPKPLSMSFFQPLPTIDCANLGHEWGLRLSHCGCKTIQLKCNITANCLLHPLLVVLCGFVGQTPHLAAFAI